MSSAQTGRDFRLDISEDGGTTWKIIGPITTKDLSNTMNTQDVTTQSDTTDYSDFCHTGYKQSAISAGGFVKNVEGVDPVSGLTFFSYKELSALANGPLGSAKALLRLMDPLETFQGTYLVGDFARTGGQSDMSEFTMSMQGTNDITHTVAP